MKTSAALACAAVLALGACAKHETKTDAAPKAAAADEVSNAVPEPAGFPKMTAAYRGVYIIHDDAKGMKNAIIENAAFRKMRIEFEHPAAEKAAAGLKLVIVFDRDAARTFAFASGPNAPKSALILATATPILSDLEHWGVENGKPPHKVGQDNVAGISCSIWETEPAAEDNGVEQACISNDGVFLWSREKGAAEPHIVATSIDRGPLPDADFAVPTGYETVDMSECVKLMRDFAASLRSGAKPDLAKMKQCQELSTRAAAIMGGAGRGEADDDE